MHDLMLGIQRKTLLKLVVMGGIVLLLVSPLVYFNWDSILTEGRLARFESFENPFNYANSSGLQVVNSYYAIGSGGIFGLGLGKAFRSMVTCLNRIPTLSWPLSLKN